MITEMDPISKAILTDSNFDFSSLTREDCVTMILFWRQRFANPNSALFAWITLISRNNFHIWNLMSEALLGGGNPSNKYKPSLNEDAEFIADVEYIRTKIKHLFSKDSPKKPEIFPELTNFDIDAAIISHGNWCEKALNIRKKELETK